MPSTWRMVKLGICLQRRKDTVMPSSLSEDFVGLVGLEDIQDGGRGGIKIIQTKPQEIQSLKTRFATGDILYGKLRPYLNKVGIAPQSGLCSTEIWAFGPSSFVLPAFATFFLASSFFVDRVESLTKGANLPRLDTEAFDSIEIPLPPISEQQRIVEILQEAEAIRHLRAQAEAKTAELIPALFASIFGDLYTGKTPFPVCLLSELGELDRGRSRHRPRDEPSLFDGPYPFLQTGDIAQSNGWVTEHTQTYSEKGLEQSRLWPKGTLAITIAANIGSTAILGFDACFPDSVVGFTAKVVVSAEYVRWWLLGYQKKLEIQAPQGAQKNINLEVLRAIRIPLPPPELQQKFDAALENIREQISANTIGDANFRFLSPSLSSHAFTGKLTEDWREQFQTELSTEARERDGALQKAGTPALSRRATIQVMDRIWDDITDGIYADLNREQRALLREIERMVGGVDYGRYFTAEQLAADSAGPLHRHSQAIESHLSVFATRGLIIPVSRPRSDSAGSRFAACYRLPLKEDDVRPERLGHQRKLAVGDI